MGHEYALDWLDQMVNELDPQTKQPESLDLDQSLAIIDKAVDEEQRLILLFKQFVFQKHKAWQIRNTVNHYLSAALSLTTIASNNLNRLPAKADNFRLALGSVISCLSHVSTFIVDRYRRFVDPDIPLYRASINPSTDELHKLAGSDVMKLNAELLKLVIDAFNVISFDHRGSEITMRMLDYWVSVSQAVTNFDGMMESAEVFDHLEVMMIERNFNSPLFVKYLTSKFRESLSAEDDLSHVLQSLAFLQKNFNQIPVMKDMVFNNQFDDLSLTINTWFIQEIDFQSKLTRPVVAELDDGSFKKARKYERKTSDKVLCNLTVDQLSLFFKAADLSNIISARLLSAIFQSVAPYLSTPHRADISHSSLRVKSYSVEERDKSLLIDIMIRLTEQIKEL